MANRTVLVRLVGEVTQFQAAMRRAGASVKDIDKQIENMPRRHRAGFEQVSSAALVTGGAVALGFGVAIKASMAFDKQMSSVGAAANATAGQLKELREAALQAGADTAFSATEAAKAQEELAKAGVSVKDILGGGLKGALDLAAAGQLDLAKAAEIAATAMTQFKLEGDDVGHVADLLSSAANKAQGSVEDVGMALSQGGLVASQFGLSIEETTGSLAAFASAGLIGSDAGTSLKTALLMLGNPTEKSAGLMERLGIAAYDTSGNFVGMANLAGQLKERLGGLTQAERDAALAQIFGSDAIRAANVLYEQGAEGIRDWTSKVDDSGNAARTAAAKMDNLAGDVEKLKGSLETALIKTGSQSTGVLRVLAQAADNTVSAFSAAPGAVQGTVTVLGLVVGGALAAAGAYGVLAPKVREAQAALLAIGPAGRVANAGLTATAKGAGVALLAISALQIAGAAMADTSAQSSGDVDRLGESLAKYGRDGKSAGELTDLLGKKMRLLNYDMSTLERDGFAGFSNGFASAVETVIPIGGKFEESITNAKKRVGELDTALADLASSGRADEAAAAFKRIAEQAKKQGVNIDELKAAFPQYTSAAKDAADASKTAGDSMQTSAGQAKVLAGGLADAIEKAGGLSEVLSGLNDINLNSIESQIAYQKKLNDMTGALKENKGAWDGTNNSALDNKQIVIDQTKVASDRLVKQYEQIKATQGEAAANQWATTTHATMRTAIINAAVAAGIQKSKVAELVDTIFKMPAAHATNVSAPGAVAAKNQINDVKDAVENLARNRLADIGVRLHGFSADAAERWARGGATPAEMAYAQRFDGARAMGGPVDAGRSYLVGERGPERFTPRAPGYITPNHKLSAAVSVSGVAQTTAAVNRANAWLDASVERLERRARDAAMEPMLGGGEGTSVRRILATARMFYPGAVVSSGFRRGDPGYHGRGLAADIIGGGPSGMARIARGFYGMSNRLLELIHSGGGGYFVKNGRRVGSGYYASVIPGHYSHVHVAANPNALSGGGRYRAGEPIIVGEHRPEMLIPDSPGYVRSNPWDGAQMVPAQTPNVDVRVFVGDREITDIVRVEVGAYDREAGRKLAHGRR